MSASFGSFSFLPWILFAQLTSPSGEGPFITPGQAEVHLTAAIHDHGGVFGEGARRRAHAALRRIQRDRRVPVVVETFKSLRGRSIDEVARRRPRPLSDDGIYILVAGLERDVSVRLFRDTPFDGPSGLDPTAIREAFLGPLRAGDADAALDQGIRAIKESVGSQSEAGRNPVVSASILVGILAALFTIRHRGSHRGRRRRRRSSGAGTLLTGDAIPHGHGSGLSDQHPPRTGDDPVHLETVKSLQGAWIADVAGQRARAAAPEQLDILLAGGERDVGLIPARHGPASRLTNQDRESIRRAFLGPLKVGQADGALEQGIQAIDTTLAAASASESKVNDRDVLISGVLLVTGLAVVLVSQTWAWYGDGSRQPCSNAAEACVIGQAIDSLWATSTASRVAPTMSANDIEEPCCAARSPVRRHEQAEA
jgi:hypothetical protein